MKFKCWVTRDECSNEIVLWSARAKCPEKEDGYYGDSKSECLIQNLCVRAFSRLTGVKLKPGEKKLIEISVKEPHQGPTPGKEDDDLV